LFMFVCSFQLLLYAGSGTSKTLPRSSRSLARRAAAMGGSAGCDCLAVAAERQESLQKECDFLYQR